MLGKLPSCQIIPRIFALRSFCCYPGILLFCVNWYHSYKFCCKLDEREMFFFLFDIHSHRSCFYTTRISWFRDRRDFKQLSLRMCGQALVVYTFTEVKMSGEGWDAV
ncbi:uncharacterized protein LOC109727160 isoform X2 [Ananas comosus]|uniref:Uncharacterized protein LOC109727160 isoform X2 n=1 Tax=Ananas comosus TaxID=4615 RepID=A0A6P5GXX4_ANACO|nr:uncharacterized protein LOC109727160 isoform X2 [Ananas comosus]